jgi:hypothetical protein
MGITEAQEKWADRFYTLIKYGKFALLTLLLLGAFVNGHKKYIADNPRKFMWDSFLVGLTSALGISAIAAMRGYADLIPNLAFICFFLFFTYNVFRELSGFNSLTADEDLTQNEAAQKRKLKYPALAFFGFAVVAGLTIAAFARVGHPDGMGALLKEATIFGILTAIGEIIVAVNHGEHSKEIAMAGLGNFGMFFLAHIVMQWGGFYTHVFHH